MSVKEARKFLFNEELNKLINMDDVIADALERVQESGIVFVDEIDKIVGDSGKTGPDVSREGVQRDILPIVEGCGVTTKYGMVHTDHILFIAAGALSVAKPSDLIPESAGTFPDPCGITLAVRRGFGADSYRTEGIVGQAIQGAPGFRGCHP